VSETIKSATVFRYVGDGAYAMGVPARDLTRFDLVEIEQREGITEADVERTGLYVVVEVVEVKPFCGAETASGGRCKRTVGAWGERCYQHQEVVDGDSVKGI